MRQKDVRTRHRISAALAVALLGAAAPAQPLIGRLKSIEVSTREAEGMAIAVPVNYVSLDVYGTRAVRFEIRENLRNFDKREVWLRLGGSAFQWLRDIREQTRFLISLPANEPSLPPILRGKSIYPEKAVDPRFLLRLDGSEPVASAQLRWITDPEEILAIVRRNLDKHNSYADQISLPLEALPTPLERLNLLRQSVDGIGVPAETPVEEMAYRWASRPGRIQERGIRLLSRYPTDRNRALLLRLLTDNQTRRRNDPAFSFGWEELEFPIRKAAAEGLKKWKIAHPPVSLDSRTRLKSLRAATVSDVGATSAQIASLADYPGLKSLAFFYRQLSVEESQVFQALPRLEKVVLQSQNEVDALLQKLSSHRDLRTLVVHYGPFKKESIAALSNLPQLSVLSLSGDALDASYLGSLAKLKQLRELYVNGVNFPVNARDELQRRLPHVKVSSDPTSVSRLIWGG